LLSVALLGLNKVIGFMIAYGDKDNNNSYIDNNHSLINDISDQIASSNIGVDKEQLKQVLQLIQAHIALTSGQDKATTAINQISTAVQSNPTGPLSQSLIFLAKQQQAGNTDSVTQAAMKVASYISNGDYNLEHSLAQDMGQSSQIGFEKPSQLLQLSSLSSLSPQPQPPSLEVPPLWSRSPTSDQRQEVIHAGDTDTTTMTLSDPNQSITEGVGQEPDTDENEANAMNRGQIMVSGNSLVLPDYTPFKSDKCDGSLDKFVPNPFIQAINSSRFLVGDCITVSGKVIWTHYINTDGDANFNVKLDSKYKSLLTPANNSPKFHGAIHVEVVCQGPNKSKDPTKVNQCKNPPYDGPKFRLPKVGTHVQVTGTYLLDVNEGGHAEIHPAYKVIFNGHHSH
jgi:hypothetical protein